MIPMDMYCPVCGELWNKEECPSCGHVSDEVLKGKKSKIRKRQKAENKEEKGV